LISCCRFCFSSKQALGCNNNNNNNNYDELTAVQGYASTCKKVGKGSRMVVWVWCGNGNPSVARFGVCVATLCCAFGHGAERLVQRMNQSNRIE
jgi:hypothetical protein